MPTMNSLLDKAAAMCSPPNDATLAKRIGVSRSAVSLWRKGNPAKDEHLAAVIELAQQDPAIAVQIRKEQAATKAERALWGPLWDRLSPVTSTVAGALLLAVLWAPSPASATTTDPAQTMHYAKWLSRRLRAWLGALNRPHGAPRHEPSPVLA